MALENRTTTTSDGENENLSSSKTLGFLGTLKKTTRNLILPLLLTGALPGCATIQKPRTEIDEAESDFESESIGIVMTKEGLSEDEVLAKYIVKTGREPITNNLKTTFTQKPKPVEVPPMQGPTQSKRRPMATPTSEKESSTSKAVGKEKPLLPDYPVSGKLAVIINGDDEEERHIENVNRAIKALRNKGFHHFFVASSQKLENPEGIEQFPGTTQGVNGLFDAIEQKKALQKDALMLFYVTGHGNKVSGKACISFKDGCYPQDRMIERLQAVKEAGARGIFVTDQCYSGSFPQAIVESGIEGVALSPGIEGKEISCQFFSKEFFERLETGYDPNHDGVSEPSEWFTAAMAAYHIGVGINDKENGRFAQSRPELTLKNIDTVLKTGKTMVIDVNATWCGACKAYRKTLDDLGGLVGAQVKIANITTDLEAHQNGELEKLYAKLGIKAEETKSLPTTLIRKSDGKFEAIPGVLPMDELLQRLATHGVKPDERIFIEILRKSSGKSPGIIRKFIKRGVYDPYIIGLSNSVDKALRMNYEQNPALILIRPDLFKTLPDFQALTEKAIRTDGDRALPMLIKADMTDTVRLLLEKGVNVDAKDKQGNPSLILAISMGRTDIIRMLLEKGANINAKGPNGNSAFIWAAIYGENADAIRPFIEKGGDVNAIGNGGTILMLAIDFGKNAEIPLLLIEKGADVNAKNENGDTALMLAAIYGHDDVAHLLIEKGADVNAKNENGVTPLILALDRMNLKIAQLLIEKGADVNAKDNKSNTPLMIVSFGGNLEIVKMLTEKGADINAKNAEGRTILTNTIILRNKEIVKLLLEKGADTTPKDNGGMTALAWATSLGLTDIVKLLLEKGIDPNAKDDDGETALQKAAWNGNSDIVRLFLEKGADVNMKDKNGLTALMWATINDKIDMVRLLIEKGADVNAKDKDGPNALDLAIQNGHTEIIQLLQPEAK